MLTVPYLGMLVVLGFIAVTVISAVSDPVVGVTDNQFSVVLAFQLCKLDVMLNFPEDAESAPRTKLSGA